LCDVVNPESKHLAGKASSYNAETQMFLDGLDGSGFTSSNSYIGQGISSFFYTSHHGNDAYFLGQFGDFFHRRLDHVDGDGMYYDFWHPITASSGQLQINPLLHMQYSNPAVLQTAVVEGLALNADGSAAYTIFSTLDGDASKRRILKFTIATASSNGQPPSGYWTTLPPPVQGGLACSSGMNTLASEKEFYSLVRNPSSTSSLSSTTSSSSSLDRYYFSNIYCVGYITMDDVNAPTFTVLQEREDQFIPSENAQSSAGSLRMLFPVHGAGSLYATFTFFPWKQNRMVAMLGPWKFGTQTCSDENPEYDMWGGLYSIYVVDFASGQVSYIAGNTQTCDYNFDLDTYTYFYAAAEGVGSSVRLYRPLSFLANPLDPEDQGYILHGPVISMVDFPSRTVKTLKDISEPAETIYVGDLVKLKAHASTGMLFLSTVQSWNGFYINSIMATASLFHYFAGSMPAVIKMFCPSASFPALFNGAGKCVSSQKCLPFSSLPEPKPCASTSPASVLGACSSGSWTCLTCPRTIEQSIEAFSEPGESCRTQCLAYKNIQAGTEVLPESAWEPVGILSTRTRCLPCWLSPSRYQTPVFQNNKFFRCGLSYFAETQGAAVCAADSYVANFTQPNITFESITVSRYCEQCPNGLKSDGISSACGITTSCPQGFFLGLDSQCSPCPSILHISVVEEEEGASHSATTTTPATNTAEDCKCPLGTYSSQNNTVCKACPAGQLCNPLNGSMTACPVGYYCESSRAYEVPMGFYVTPVPGKSKTDLIECRNGAYCPYTRMTSPLPCPLQHVCQGEVAAPCPPGFSCEAPARGVLSPCPGNRYCPGYPLPPQICPPFSRRINATACACITDDNNTKKYQLIMDPVNKTFECIECPPGFKCTASSITQLPIAAPGFYLFNETEARPCPAGTFSPYEGLINDTLCLPCPSNTWSYEGATTCSLCLSSEWSSVVAQCTTLENLQPAYPVQLLSGGIACPAGTYIGPHDMGNVMQKPPCLPCPFETHKFVKWMEPGITCKIGCEDGFVFFPNRSATLQLSQMGILTNAAFCAVNDIENVDGGGDGGYVEVWDKGLQNLLGNVPAASQSESERRTAPCRPGSHRITSQAIRQGKKAVCRQCAKGKKRSLLCVFFFDQFY
jgi:hypothetical protein